MGKASRWLIAPIVLIELVGATSSGRYALNADVTEVGSHAAAVHRTSVNDVGRFDTSPHKTTFVTVLARPPLAPELTAARNFLAGK